MNNQILFALKRKLVDFAASGNDDVETQRNALKEALQYYVLNFIYHHSEYSKWTMYGGSALRICHGLDRMSVDLDFEVTHDITEPFLDTLSGDIEAHFSNTYGTGSDLLTIKPTTGRGLRLCFHVAHALGINHPSDQVHVKIDLNTFTAPKASVERWPINQDQLSFVIRTYNMGTLMASKLAAIFLRGQRGVGAEVYEEKGWDIYDLLWYMGKQIVPDLGYLDSKNVKFSDLRTLFDRLTLQMNKVNDANLKQDLTPLFVNRRYIENWLDQWRETYLRLLEAYRIRTITTLKGIDISVDFRSEIHRFTYAYSTEDGGWFRITFALSGNWIFFREGDLPIAADEHVSRLIKLGDDGGRRTSEPSEKLRQYATLFHQKSSKYLAKGNNVVFGDGIVTKVIRMTAEGFNQREQILLNKSALLTVELEDLLR